MDLYIKLNPDSEKYKDKLLNMKHIWFEKKIWKKIIFQLKNVLMIMISLNIG